MYPTTLLCYTVLHYTVFFYTVLSTPALHCTALQGLDTNIQVNFHGWVDPVDLFIHTDKYLGSVSTTTFSLHTLMPWSNLAELRSGLSSGKTSLLNTGSGASSLLSLLRIFVEVKYCTALYYTTL